MTAKEVGYALGWSKTTIWRRKKEGCPFVGGRIGDVTLAWWMELRDAARQCGKSVAEVWKWPRWKQEKLLAKVAAGRN